MQKLSESQRLKKSHPDLGRPAGVSGTPQGRVDRSDGGPVAAVLGAENIPESKNGKGCFPHQVRSSCGIATWVSLTVRYIYLLTMEIDTPAVKSRLVRFYREATSVNPSGSWGCSSDKESWRACDWFQFPASADCTGLACFQSTESDLSLTQWSRFPSGTFPVTTRGHFFLSCVLGFISTVRLFLILRQFSQHTLFIAY